MKASDKHQEQEALDLLFFEYLEEELPAAEAEALEQRLAHEPALQDELDSWKDTYVSQEFYDTTALEARLQANLADKPAAGSQPASYFSFFNSLNVVVPFVLTTLLSFMLATDQSPKPIKVFPERSEVEASTSFVSDISGQPATPVTGEEESSTIAVPEMADRNPPHETEKQPVVAYQEEKEQPERNGINHLPQIASLSMEMQHCSIVEAAPLVNVKKIRIPKKAKENNISRRQQRMIDKKKDKALQERQAREFMKGNVPYVVPLNSQNF